MALRDAIVLDPFAERPWRLWIDRFGDPDGELARAAAILALDTVSHAKRDALEAERGRLDWSSAEACHVSGTSLGAAAARLSLPFTEEARAIAARADRLDAERRTWGGTLYPTVEAVQAARAADEDRRRRTIDGREYSSLGEADAARAERSDLEARTFEGRIYESREAAVRARAEYRRSTSLTLWLSIIVAPPNGAFTFRSGFTWKQRTFAVIWFLLLAIGPAMPMTPGEAGGFVTAMAIWSLLVLGVRLLLDWMADRTARLFSRSSSEPRGASLSG